MGGPTTAAADSYGRFRDAVEDDVAMSFRRLVKAMLRETNTPNTKMHKGVDAAQRRPSSSRVVLAPLVRSESSHENIGRPVGFRTHSPATNFSYRGMGRALKLLSMRHTWFQNYPFHKQLSIIRVGWRVSEYPGFGQFDGLTFHSVSFIVCTVLLEVALLVVLGETDRDRATDTERRQCKCSLHRSA